MHNGDGGHETLYVGQSEMRGDLYDLHPALLPDLSIPYSKEGDPRHYDSECRTNLDRHATAVDIT
jgi:hypothetical protein